MKESVIIMTEFNEKHATAVILTLPTLGYLGNLQLHASCNINNYTFKKLKQNLFYSHVQGREKA